MVGLDPAAFSATHDLPGNVSRVLIPTLLRDLGKSGIIVKGIAPFDAHVGVFPSSLFVRAVLRDRSVLHYVNPVESKILDHLSESLCDISQEKVERRWLAQIGAAFLCVAPSSGLSVSNFSRALAEFDGKEKRVGAVLAALHEREVVTLATVAGQPEIFLLESLLDGLEDRDLVEKLREPKREPIPFAFVARERQRLEQAVTITEDAGEGRRAEGGGHKVKRGRRPAVIEATVKERPSPVSSRDERGEGNKAGREVRDRILRVFERAASLKMGDLMSALEDLHLSDANVRYHVDLLCEKGVLARDGRGRGARIFVPGTPYL